MSGIQIENLVKTYGDNIAVNGLNLNLEKGKVYGFLPTAPWALSARGASGRPC